MMAATSGGSYVLQPSNMTAGNATNVVTTSTVVNQNTVRTLQGIKVIPVNNQRPTATMITSNQGQHNSNNSVAALPTHHQLVARIISGRAGMQPTQIMIPSSSAFQPMLVQTQPQNANATGPILQQNSQQIAISVQPQKIATSQVTTVSLPIQPQKR